MAAQESNFLDRILSEKGIIDQRLIVLADSAQRRLHGSATLDILSALCVSSKIFEQRGVDLLLQTSPPTLFADRVRDLSWLTRLGELIDPQLKKAKVYWPPPNPSNPTSVIPDLVKMYGALGGSLIISLSPPTKQSLIEAISFIKTESCAVRSSANARKSLLGGRTLESRRLLSQISASLSLCALFVALPGDINSFPDELVTMLEHIGQLARWAYEGIVQAVIEMKTVELRTALDLGEL